MFVSSTPPVFPIHFLFFFGMPLSKRRVFSHYGLAETTLSLDLCFLPQCPSFSLPLFSILWEAPQKVTSKGLMGSVFLGY